MKIEIFRISRGVYGLEFSHGSQFFRLWYTGNMQEVKWMKEMLNKCFCNYELSVITNYTKIHEMLINETLKSISKTPYKNTKNRK